MEENLTCLSRQHVARRFFIKICAPGIHIYPSLRKLRPPYKTILLFLSHRVVCTPSGREDFTLVRLLVASSIVNVSRSNSDERMGVPDRWEGEKRRRRYLVHSSHVHSLVRFSFTIENSMNVCPPPPLEKRRIWNVVVVVYEGREYEKYLQHSIEFVSGWVMRVRHPRGNFYTVCKERCQPPPFGSHTGRSKEKQTKKQNKLMLWVRVLFCP